METQVRMLEDFAIGQCLNFRRIKDQTLQIKVIFNEINCLHEFISSLNPTTFPQADVRYRAYVLQILKEFEENEEIFKAILTGKIA